MMRSRPFAVLQISHHEGPFPAHALRIGIHFLQRRADIWRQVDLVDDKQVRLSDAGTAVPVGNLIRLAGNTWNTSHDARETSCSLWHTASVFPGELFRPIGGRLSLARRISRLIWRGLRVCVYYYWLISGPFLLVV